MFLLSMEKCSVYKERPIQLHQQTLTDPSIEKMSKKELLEKNFVEMKR
jgi:hypothetical protein